MSERETPVATIAGTPLYAREFLIALRQSRRLAPLVLEVAVERIIVAAARQAGLTIPDAELQAAANAFRQQHGLTSAEQTHAWFVREGLTVEDFEADLERKLLIHKFRHHLTQPGLIDHFSAHSDRHVRARVRLIVVASEEAARELLTQVKEDGADFAELARLHSLHFASRLAGGSIGVVARRDLPGTADTVFVAHPGDIVGPISTGQGYHLFLVEEVLPAELDEATSEVIRRELFDAWLREQMPGVHLDLEAL